MPVTPTEAIGAPNVGGVDDHQHSGEVSAAPFAPFRHLAFFWLCLGVVMVSVSVSRAACDSAALRRAIASR
jgi:hypothetical protein